MTGLVALFGQVGVQFGGVAQLGEHLLCKQGVTGSIPVVSIPRVCRANAVLAHGLVLSQPAPSRCGDNRLLANDESCSPKVPSTTSTGCIAECPEFGLIMCSGKASWVVWSCRLSGCPVLIVGAVAVVLCNVNQVLVRLWARVMEIGPSGRVDIPLFSRLV
jgi:hypothetical protein